MNPETESTRSSERRPEVDRLYEHGRTVSEDAKTLVEDVQGFADDARSFIAAQVEQRPYAVVGLAACIGYVLGGGIPPFAFRALLGLGGRIAFDRVIKGVVSGVGAQSSAPSGHVINEQEPRL